jgi:hypothetical protein
MPRTLPKVNEWSEKDNRIFKVVEVVPARIIPASVVLEGNGEQVTLSVADYLNTHKRMAFITTRSRKKVGKTLDDIARENANSTYVTKVGENYIIELPAPKKPKKPREKKLTLPTGSTVSGEGNRDEPVKVTIISASPTILDKQAWPGELKVNPDKPSILDIRTPEKPDGAFRVTLVHPVTKVPTVCHDKEMNKAIRKAVEGNGMPVMDILPHVDERQREILMEVFKEELKPNMVKEK